MNLTILQYDAANQRHVLRLKQGPWAGQAFNVELDVCPHPMCGCTNLDFHCLPVAGSPPPSNDESSLDFSLDTAERQIATLVGKPISPAARALAAAVVAELQEADWRELHGYLMNVKNECIEKTDVTKLDAQFPPEVMAGNGTMVGYTEIFPFGDLADVQFGDDGWVVDDQYCVDHDCECHDVRLTFLHVPNGIAPDKPIAFDQMPSVFYDYMSGRMGKVMRRPRAGQPTLEELLQAAKRKRPTFDLEVQNRHLRLRNLYLRARLKESAVMVPQDVSPPKIGRNDPCPCGSGKKYKKCCVGNPTQASG